MAWRMPNVSSLPLAQSSKRRAQSDLARPDGRVLERAALKELGNIRGGRAGVKVPKLDTLSGFGSWDHFLAESLPDGLSGTFGATVGKGVEGRGLDPSWDSLQKYLDLGITGEVIDTLKEIRAVGISSLFLILENIQPAGENIAKEKPFLPSKWANLPGLINRRVFRGEWLSLETARLYSYQVFEAAAYCHQRRFPVSCWMPDLQVHMGDLRLVRIGNWPTGQQLSMMIVMTCLPPASRRDYMRAMEYWNVPPEYLIPHRDCVFSTASADCWALGCLMAELLTGRSPFAGRCRISVLFNICMALGPPPHPWRYGELFDQHAKEIKYAGPDLRYALGIAALHAACPQAVELLKKILVFKPRKRLQEPSKVLKDPFFSGLADWRSTLPPTSMLFHDGILKAASVAQQKKRKEKLQQQQ